MIPLLDDRMLDDDHEELERLVTAFSDDGLARAKETLDALRAHAGRHFAAEDADLRRMKGGNAECHVDEHAAVLASLREVRQLLDDPARDPAANERMLSSLAAELKRWLPAHVGEMDRALADFRFRERTGGGSIRIMR
jgi:hemerythrin-like metal-binding protein